MALLHRRLRQLFRRARRDAELDEEIRFHLDREAQLRSERGESREQAMQAARRDFGNVALVKETTRQMWGWTLAEDLARDLRHSLRMLARAPLFTAVAVLSLALGIGANTAIFSLADAVIFRELPVREPRQLFQVRSVHERGRSAAYSFPLYQDIRDRNQVFSATVCAGSFAIPEPLELVFPGGARRETRAQITLVSGNYFETLGVEPILGRAFTLEDDRAPGAHTVAVVSYRFWRRDLNGDPDLLETRLAHNRTTYQIVGVAPPGFTGISSNDDPDVWFPVMMSEIALTSPGKLKSRDSSWLYVFGRLKPGVSGAGASADAARIFGELQAVYRNYQGQRGEVVPMAKGIQALRERFEQPLLVLLAVVGLLLLIALLAGYFPARRACRIDPIQALRHE